MHPHQKEAREGYKAKLRKMTTDYGGAAGSSENKLAPTNAEKPEGTEEAIGFGAQGNGEPARTRGDRVSRRRGVTNPVATYKHGGKVKRHARKRAEGGDVSSIEQANRDQAMTANRARGGRTGKKGSTHVNVIVAPQQGAHPGMTAPMPPVLAGGAPPAPAVPPRPAMPPIGAAGPMSTPMAGPGGLPIAAGAPGGIPPGLIPPRKRGGRVKRHEDEAEDEALIHKVLKDEGLERKSTPRARVGRAPKMTAGAETGEGRLEKVEMRRRNARHERPQAT